MKKGVSGDRNSGFFKKRNTIARATLNIHITEEEAALAQSHYNVEKITEIQSRFTGGETLLVPGRVFIREGPLWKVCRKEVKKRLFFLFNDILIYGSIVGNRCSNQHVLPLSQMVVSSRCEYVKDISLQFSQEQLGEGLDMLNAFQVNHAEKSFHVVALTSADKNNWLSNLTKYTKKASAQEASVETRAIWVPDSLARECMVCGARFTAFIRKHHCRKCGRVVCSGCSPHRLGLGTRGSSPPTEERVCSHCFQHYGHASNRGSTHTVPPPHPAPTARTTPTKATPTEATPTEATTPNTSDYEGESTDTEDSDDSEEIAQTQEAPPHTQEAPPHTQEAPPHTQEAPPHTQEAPPHTQEAPPHTQEAPPHTQEAPPHTQEAPPHTQEAPPHTQEAPPHTQEAPPHTQEAPPHTQEAPVQIASITLEERRPTPPPRRKKNKGHLEAIGRDEEHHKQEVGVSTVAIGDVKGSPDVTFDRPSIGEAHCHDDKKALWKHRRKKKYFVEGQETSGGQETSSGGQETSGGHETSPGGQETFPGGQETSLGGQETSLGGQETSLGGQETSLGGQVMNVDGQSSSQDTSHHIQDTAGSRKSARRRHKFAVEHVS